MSLGNSINPHLYRRLTALLLSLQLFIIAPGVHANTSSQEDLVTAITRWFVLQANPVYVIAVPSQDKLPATPPNLPVGTLRKPVPTPAPEDVVGPPFSMTPAQAVKIGDGLILDGEFHAALVYFQAAQKSQPPLADALIGLAECYYEIQRDDEALATYQSLSEQQANIWEVQFNLGRIHLEHGRFSESVAAFRNAVRLKPNDPETTRNLGVALTKLGRYSEALEYLSQVTALKRYEPEDFYALGEAHANLGNWVQAADAFKTGVDKRAIDPDAYSKWGRMLYNADQMEQALEAFKKAKTLDIQHLESFYYMADIYRRLGNSIDALAHYRMVLRQKPNDVQVLIQAAYICFKLNLLGEAEQHYKQLKTLDPTNSALANLAALESSDNEKKVDLHRPTPGVTLREVVVANPNHGESHVNLGAQLITEGVFPEAVTVLQKAVTLLPDSAAAHFNLGLAQLKVGDYQGAVTSNQLALKLKPEWSVAYNDLGLAYAGVNKWTEASHAYQEAIRLTPQYAGATYNLGRAYLALGRKDMALPLLETLKKLSGFDLQARLANAIGGVELPLQGVVAAPTPEPPAIIPTPSPTVKTEDLQPQVVETKTLDKSTSVVKEEPDKVAPELGCPGPIYRAADVTQVAKITSELPPFYTDDALKNNVEGALVVQAIFCGTGRVSDITVEKSLPSGLTERAIEILKLVQFQPAQLDNKPVSVMWRQEFVCAQSACKAVPK
jgi:tetratricopeptide (TPR) repeat protein